MRWASVAAPFQRGLAWPTIWKGADHDLVAAAREESERGLDLGTHAAGRELSRLGVAPELRRRDAFEPRGAARQVVEPDTVHPGRDHEARDAQLLGEERARAV